MLCGHRQKKVLLKGIHVLILEEVKVVSVINQSSLEKPFLC